MSSRTQLVIVAVGFAAVLAAQVWSLSRDQSGERYWRTIDRQTNAMVDRLIFTDSADAFRAGRMWNIELQGGQPDMPAHITLGREQEKGYPRTGIWTSPPMRTDFPITEVLPSWNVITPEHT